MVIGLSHCILFTRNKIKDVFATKTDPGGYLEGGIVPCSPFLTVPFSKEQN